MNNVRKTLPMDSVAQNYLRAMRDEVCGPPTVRSLERGAPELRATLQSDEPASAFMRAVVEEEVQSWFPTVPAPRDERRDTLRSVER